MTNFGQHAAAVSSGIRVPTAIPFCKPYASGLLPAVANAAVVHPEGHIKPGEKKAVPIVLRPPSGGAVAVDSGKQLVGVSPQ